MSADGRVLSSKLKACKFASQLGYQATLNKLLTLCELRQLSLLPSVGSEMSSSLQAIWWRPTIADCTSAGCIAALVVH